MVKFTHYDVTDANVTDSIKSSANIDAGYLVSYRNGALEKADDFSGSIAGVVLGVPGVDNRVGNNLSVAVKSAGVLVRCASTSNPQIGEVLYANANGEVATDLSTSEVKVGTALGSSQTLDGIKVVLVRML